MQHNDEYLRQVHLKKCGSENSEAVSGQRAAPQISGGKDKTLEVSCQRSEPSLLRRRHI